jgi:hypothetical protein
VDCEKFDRIVLDLLYEELDELTSAAAKRHMEHCARCRGIVQGLRATRQVGILPMIEAPAGLEQRILAAEDNARAGLPLRQRLGRTISVLAGYAMRPQLAMAALLMLMIGASLLFLRVRPGAREHVRVTERGVPEAENDTVTVVPAPEKARAGEQLEAHGAPSEREARRERSAAAAEPEEPFASPPPAAQAEAKTAAKDELSTENGVTGDGGSGDQDFDQAMSDYRAGRWYDAQKNFDTVASRGSGNSASAALFAAQSLRNGSGCDAAAPRFETVSVDNRGTGIGNEATWQAADCYRAVGRMDDARRNYKLLVGVPGYDERAQNALASLDEERVASRKAKVAAPAAKPTAGTSVQKAQAGKPAPTK